MFCKNCQGKIKDGCLHPDCVGVRAQGFCQPSCRTTYQRIMRYQLTKAVEQFREVKL